MYLQIGESGLHLLRGLQLGLLRLLLLAEDRLHRADEALPLQLEAPPCLTRHARARLPYEGRLRRRKRLGAVAVADERLLLELLHRRVLEQDELLHEQRLEARRDRRAQLLAASGVQGSHLRVALGALSVKLVERIANDLVGLRTKRRYRLTTNHALAQRRHLCLCISERRA